MTTNWPHEFVGSESVESENIDSCAICTRRQIDHTDRATCDSCGCSGLMEPKNDLLLCSDCIRPPEDVLLSPPDATEILRRDTLTVGSIQTSIDLFNAETATIHELRVAIENDPNIENKPFTLAKAVESRFQHYSKLLYDKRAEVLEIESKQRAVQTYYNEFAKRLREAERAEIRLRDTSYKPKVAEIKQPKQSGPKKDNRAEIKSWAIKSGFPEALIKTIMVSKGCTAEEAVKRLQGAGA